MRLLVIEVRRYLARRATRGLMLTALVAIGLVTLAVYGANEPLDGGPPGSELDPRFLTSVFPEDDPQEGSLMLPAILVPIMAAAAGASMIGAEWKAGTFTNLLTWEPRRTRVIASKFAAAGLLATVIAAALLVLFVLAFVPTVSSKGSTTGADGSWYRFLGAGIAKMAVVAGLSAVVGGAIAMIARSSAAGIGVALGYFMIGETLIRTAWPGWVKWLITNNAITWFTDGEANLTDAPDPATSALILCLYTAVAAIVAWALFLRRDVAGAS